MKLELFFYFDGNCREAVEFYAKVFRSEVSNLMTYRDAPGSPDNPVSEADRDRIIYAGVAVGDMVVMFSDGPSGFPVVAGNNISPTVSTDDKNEVERLYGELKEGGEVLMELQQTFFSELYGMVKDKYGIIWQILYYARAEG